jgi:hypothetical protein
VADLRYLISRYGDDEAWLRVRGKPAIFVYDRALRSLSPADWEEVLAKVPDGTGAGAVFIADSHASEYTRVFDGASTYNITGITQHKSPSEIRTWANLTFSNYVKAAGPGKISTITIIPGYDDRPIGRPGVRPVTARWGGEVYRALWEEAIAASPDWVLITSWNEWHEGSEIEPSIEYGSIFLEQTAVSAQKFISAQKHP